MELDKDKMLEAIDALVSTDFCADMEMKTVCNKWQQTDARKMANIIAKVYSIAHCIHCDACATKWKICDT